MATPARNKYAVQFFAMGLTFVRYMEFDIWVENCPDFQ